MTYSYIQHIGQKGRYKILKLIYNNLTAIIIFQNQRVKANISNIWHDKNFDSDQYLADNILEFTAREIKSLNWKNNYI